MIEPKWKRVNKIELDRFIKDYPRELEKHEVMTCSPPLLTYNDFKLGNYPNSVIAKEWEATDIEGDLWYIPENDRYWIMENYKEAFESKIENFNEKMVTVDYLIEFLQELHRRGNGDMKICCMGYDLYENDTYVNDRENKLYLKGEIYSYDMHGKFRKYIEEIDKLYKEFIETVPIGFTQRVSLNDLKIYNKMLKDLSDNNED